MACCASPGERQGETEAIWLLGWLSNLSSEGQERVKSRYVATVAKDARRNERRNKTLHLKCQWEKKRLKTNTKTHNVLLLKQFLKMSFGKQPPSGYKGPPD